MFHRIVSRESPWLNESKQFPNDSTHGPTKNDAITAVAIIGTFLTIVLMVVLAHRWHRLSGTSRPTTTDPETQGVTREYCSSNPTIVSPSPHDAGNGSNLSLAMHSDSPPNYTSYAASSRVDSEAGVAMPAAAWTKPFDLMALGRTLHTKETFTAITHTNRVIGHEMA